MLSSEDSNKDSCYRIGYLVKIAIFLDDNCTISLRMVSIRGRGLAVQQMIVP